MGFGLSYVTLRIVELFWESRPEGVKASYTKSDIGADSIQSRTGHEKPCLKEGGPPPKAKYYLVTDSV